MGETRNIRVEKFSEEPLGIKIGSVRNCGIFVSSVSDNSLANKAGIQIGDQLLEVRHSLHQGSNTDYNADCAFNNEWFLVKK